MQSTTGKTTKEIVKREIKRLEKIKESGLPKGYKNNFDGYLSFYYSEFSTNATIKKEFRALLESAPWRKAARDVQKAHGYDFIEAVTHWEACVKNL